MKPLTYLLVFILIVSCAPSQHPLKEGMYRLHGAVTNMENGNIYLVSSTGTEQIIDTLVVKDGVFNYEGEIPGLVQEITISKFPNISSEEDAALLYVEPAIMELTIDATNFSTAKLTGSKSQDDADKLTAQREKVSEKYKMQLDAFEENRKLYDASTTEEDKKKYKWLDDELRTELAPYYEEMDVLVKQFVLDHPTSFVSLQNLGGILNKFEKDEVKTIYDNFPTEYKEGFLAQYIGKAIDDMDKGIIGAKAGDFNSTDINGNPIALADFKGQYLLIDFWASWCVPCRKGNPHLLDLYAKYKSKGLEILGVSDDDRNHDAWRKAVKDDQIGVWRHVLRGMEVDRSNGGFKLLNDGISGGYNISTLPTKILVGPDGIIVGRYGGGGEDDAAMDKKLAELFGA